MILSLAASAYRLVTTIRNSAYDKGLIAQQRSRLPVICVGNVHAGGSGKTPMILYLIDLFREQGYSPVVLTRGYGGNYEGLHVLREEDDAEVCGDEALLIYTKKKVPVVCCRDRVKGAMYIEHESMGDLVLLDDGFQHRRLIRDYNILTMSLESDSAFASFDEDLHLPKGELREARDSALHRADALLLLKRSVNVTTEKTFQERINRVKEIASSDIPIFEGHIRAQEVRDFNGKPLSVKEVHALCAIAHPEAFFETLEYIGYTLVTRTSLRDHAKISRRLLQRLRSTKDVPIVCTEKDLMRMSPKHRQEFASLEIQIELRDPARFEADISAKLQPWHKAASFPIRNEVR